VWSSAITPGWTTARLPALASTNDPGITALSELAPSRHSSFHLEDVDPPKGEIVGTLSANATNAAFRFHRVCADDELNRADLELCRPEKRVAPSIDPAGA
jgi:hypothetical protein